MRKRCEAVRSGVKRREAVRSESEEGVSECKSEAQMGTTLGANKRGRRQGSGAQQGALIFVLSSSPVRFARRLGRMREVKKRVQGGTEGRER